jgi:hypothetical protein
MYSSHVSGANPGRCTGSPKRASSATRRSRLGGLEAPLPHRESGGERHAGGHRLAMQPLAVAARGFDRVAEGMAEIEQRRDPGLALVLGDDLGLDLAGAAGSRARAPRGRAAAAAALRLDPVEEGQVADRAVLATSASPRRTPAAAAMPRVAVSAITALGWWKAPTMFLPSGWLIAVFPPTEESTCASSVVGTCRCAMPALVGGRGETRHVAHDAPAHARPAPCGGRPARAAAR